MLRAATAVTGNLAGRNEAAISPHIVRSMETRDHRTVAPTLPFLPAAPLAKAFAEPARTFTAAVLAGPIDERVGTAHPLAAVLTEPDIGLRWAKIGTANAAGGGNLTRTAWVAGGLVFRGEPLSFMAVVAAPSNRAPLGHVEASDIAVPLAAALLDRLLPRLSSEEPIR